MRRLLRSLSFAALACLPLAARPAAAAAGDCRQAAMDELRTSAPDGFSVYRRIKDQQFFTRWIDCDDMQLSLSTAVHESVHFITAQTDAFPLVDGGEVKRPHEVSAFFAPSLIARRFKPDDFTSMYLRPSGASAGTDFLYLLDELNAYTHDLNAAVDLKGFRAADEEVDNRDGLAALMAFVAVYAETAEGTDPATWEGLHRPQVAATVADLWGRAERVMASSCGIPNFGREDRMYIRQVCSAPAQAAMASILGRTPVCPTACLTSAPAADMAAGDAARAETTGAEATSLASPRADRLAADTPTAEAARNAPLDLMPAFLRKPPTLQPFVSRNLTRRMSRDVVTETVTTTTIDR